MTPDDITAIESDPVDALRVVLHTSDSEHTKPLLGCFAQLVRDKPSSRAAARYSALNVYTRAADPNVALTMTELTEVTHVTVSALSQTATRVKKQLDLDREKLAKHAVIAYTTELVGQITPIATLPTWLRAVVTARPSPLDIAWGSPNDLAQYVTRLALNSKQLVPGWDTGEQASDLWITEDGKPLSESLDELVDMVSGGKSRLFRANELSQALADRHIAPRHLDYVTSALTRNRNILWIPTANCYVAFERRPTEQRKSRGNAVQRAADVLTLIEGVEHGALATDLADQFVVQHSLGRSTADNAIREAATR